MDVHLSHLATCLIVLVSSLLIFEPVFFLNECVLQDVRAEISGFLQQLRFEVMREHFNTAALQCELHLGSQLASPTQVAKAGEELGLPVLVSGQPDFTHLVSLFFLLCMPRRRLSVGFGNSVTLLWLLFHKMLFFFILLFSVSRYHLVKVQ